MSVYYASKAYVLHFSEALAEELAGSGVTVTCLCPGPVKTNFQKRASHRRETSGNQPFAVDVREVARVGYEGMKQGKRLVIPGWKNQMVVEMLRFAPRSVVTRMIKKSQGAKN